jgi:hypothetical protein
VPCSTSADCAEGRVCTTTECCGGRICVPVCSVGSLSAAETGEGPNSSGA